MISGKDFQNVYEYLPQLQDLNLMDEVNHSDALLEYHLNPRGLGRATNANETKKLNKKALKKN